MCGKVKGRNDTEEPQTVCKRQNHDNPRVNRGRGARTTLAATTAAP